MGKATYENPQSYTVVIAPSRAVCQKMDQNRTPTNTSMGPGVIMEAMKVNRPLGLITDLDDTLKITNTTNRLKTVVRGLFKNQAYAGMSELYQELLKDTTNRLWVVSSSPNVLRRKIARFLKLNQYPPSQLILRDWLKEKKVKSYKLKAVTSIIESQSDLGFLLIGDDSEWDPEVYLEVKRLYPKRIEAIYIRKIRNRPLPRDVVGFCTAYEVALHELRKQNLSLSQVARIGKSLLDTDDFEQIIPYFAHHPLSLNPQSTEDSLVGVESWLERRLHLRR